jgi:hypothetical protein
MPVKYLLAISKRSAKNSSQRGPSEALARWITREQSIATGRNEQSGAFPFRRTVGPNVRMSFE